MLSSRFVKFHKGLITSSKFAIRFLGRIKECDNRTVMGKTLACLLAECDLLPTQLTQLTPGLVKKKCRYFPVPTGHEWKAPVIKECLKVISGNLEVQGFEAHKFSSLVNRLCTD